MTVNLHPTWPPGLGCCKALISRTHTPTIAHEPVDEVDCVLPSDAALRDAVRRVADARFDRDRMILPCAGASGAARGLGQNPKTETDEPARCKAAPLRQPSPQVPV